MFSFFFALCVCAQTKTQDQPFFRMTDEKQKSVQNTLLENARNKGYNPQLLDLGKRRGLTNYIDFVQVDDMKAPIMFGTDLFRRPFVSFLLQDQEGLRFVISAFQRYTEDPYCWCVGGRRHCFFFKHNSRDIIDKCSRLFAGDSVASYDAEESIRLCPVQETGT